MNEVYDDERFMLYVEKRLAHWALWYSRGNFYGLGFHSETIEYVLMTVGIMVKSTGVKPLPCDEEAEEIEELIVKMEKQNKKLALALGIQYFGKRKSRDRSEELDVCASKFNAYVVEAKQWLAGRLSERIEARKKF